MTKKYILTVLAFLSSVSCIFAAKPKEPEPQKWFNFKENTTIVGVGLGWGPSFKYDGAAKNYWCECFNVTAAIHYNENDKYIHQGPLGYCDNPSIYTFAFGYDVPVYRKNRFQFNLNPTFGWEVKYFYGNAHYTKLVPVIKQHSGFKFGMQSNFDIRIVDDANARVGVKYINDALYFSIGLSVHKK